jgi:solute carrier family 25 carnitine/acylcarnitine transporter 20/29
MTDYINGVLGGFARAIIGHPFDTIKTKLQINPIKYKNAFDCLKIIVREQGVLSLYKGLTAPLLFNGLIVGTHFYVYDNYKKNNNVFLVGGIAGLCASIFSNPIEFVRIKMQLANKLDNHKNYKNIFDCSKCILENKGFFGLFTGQRITSIREFVGYSAFFGCYEFCPNLTDKEFLNKVIKGSLCGFSLWGSMYPIDVIKTHIHGQVLENKSYNEIWHIKNIFKNYGIKGFYKGFGITMIRAIPVNIGIVCTIDFYNGIK